VDNLSWVTGGAHELESASGTRFVTKNVEPKVVLAGVAGSFSEAANTNRSDLPEPVLQTLGGPLGC